MQKRQRPMPARTRKPFTRRLDELCGEVPKHRIRCSLCKRVVGPYHVLNQAKAAMRLHVQWVHYPEDRVTEQTHRD